MLIDTQKTLTGNDRKWKCFPIDINKLKIVENKNAGISLCNTRQYIYILMVIYIWIFMCMYK